MNDKIKFNWPHVGNKHIKEFLEKSIINNKNINSTYIVNGPDDLGKTTTAYYFAKSLLCKNSLVDSYNGPCEKCPACLSIKNKNKLKSEEEKISEYSDFFVVRPQLDKKNITIEQVRQFINSMSMTSFLGSYKVGIIKHADKLSKEAANALLKTLEEPKKNVVIILITEDYENLPSTIVSRSQVLEFYPVSTDEIYTYLIKELRASRSQAKNFARLSLGRPAMAAKFLQDNEFYETYISKVKVFLNFFKQDINMRIKGIQELFGESLKGQEAVKQVEQVLRIWEGVLRDIVLTNLNLGNLIQHEIVKDSLMSMWS